MARQFNFRDAINSFSGSESNQLPDFILCIETTVILRFGNAAEMGFTPPGTDFCQTGIFPDLDPPALVICQMPVHPVDPAYSGGGKQPPDICRRHKMAATVQHKGPMRKRKVHIHPPLGVI